MTQTNREEELKEELKGYVGEYDFTPDFLYIAVKTTQDKTLTELYKMILEAELKGIQIGKQLQKEEDDILWHKEHAEKLKAQLELIEIKQLPNEEIQRLKEEIETVQLNFAEVLTNVPQAKSYVINRIKESEKK